MKGQKGITLVALIITIVLLLILATVTITTITTDGLFDKANAAVQGYNKVQSEEKLTTDGLKQDVDTYFEKYPPKS